MSVGNLHMLMSNIRVPTEFELLRSSSFVNEGSSFSITLNVKSRPTWETLDGNTYNYTIDGSINADDIPGTNLSGTFTLQNDQAVLNVNTAVNDDTIAFVLGNTGTGERTIHKYRINRDLTNPVFESSFTVPTGQYLGMYFRSNGSRLYLQNPSANQFREYGMIAQPSADQWDLNVLGTVFPTDLTYPYGSFGTANNNRQGMWISDDGTKLFQVDRDVKRIYYNIVSPAWDLRQFGSGVGSPTNSKDIAADAQLPSGIFVSPSGTRAFVSSLANPSGILQYNGDPFFLGSWSLAHTLIDENIFPTDVFFDSSGARMYVCSELPNVIQYYELTTVYDISTATLVRTWDLSGTFNSIHAMHFVNPPSETFRITVSDLELSTEVLINDNFS